MSFFIALLIDLLLIAVAVYYIARGARRGLIATLILMVSWIVSFFGAQMLSDATAPAIYDQFVSPAIESGVRDNLTGSESTEQLAGNIAKQIDTLPGFVKNAVHYAFPDLTDSLYSAANGGLQQAPHTVAQTIARPALIPLLGSLLFFVYFMILSFVLRAVSRIFTGRIRIPVIGQLNTLLGGVLGAVQGLIVIVLVMLLLELLVMVSNDGWEYLNRQILEQTYVYRAISAFIPFHWMP